ncbi:MAG: hypothetical protein NVV73_10045 [Cellvibrionaceae bacterium]|nr:hypothetical protein [Cellvibrionaceae bacterium]
MSGFKTFATPDAQASTMIEVRDLQHHEMLSAHNPVSANNIAESQQCLFDILLVAESLESASRIEHNQHLVESLGKYLKILINQTGDHLGPVFAAFNVKSIL